MKSVRYLKLKAIRQGLGLTVADAAALVNVSKRTFQYWEAGERNFDQMIEMRFDYMASHYHMVLENMLKDVQRTTIHNTEDDTKPSRISPTLPFFHSFEHFKDAVGCSHITYWRIYQSVISQLILLGKIVRLNDEVEIPADFWIWRWFAGEFEAK